MGVEIREFVPAEATEAAWIDWNQETNAMLFEVAPEDPPVPLRPSLEEWPEAKWVRAGNANSNAPMLKINHALGFRPRHTHIERQVEVTRVRAYLEG